MVIWCKQCGAFMGLRIPLADWTTDREATCARCAEKKADPNTPEGHRDEQTPLPKQIHTNSSRK